MRLLTFLGESYADEAVLGGLCERLLDAVRKSGALLHEWQLSPDRSAAMFLVEGQPEELRGLWRNVDASGLENAWLRFGFRLDWQEVTPARQHREGGASA